MSGCDLLDVNSRQDVIAEIFRHRRSVRTYDGTPIQDAQLKQILEVGLLAPTGRNLKPVEFIVIQERDTLRDLAFLRKSGSRMLEQSGAAILVLADTEKTDTWVEDAAIAMAYMHLAADALGLGSCWVQMRGRYDVHDNDLDTVLRQRFGFPKKMQPLAILALGNTNSHPSAHAESDLSWEKIHKEKY